jgi:Protein of unknown function (DUF1353)
MGIRWRLHLFAMVVLCAGAPNLFAQGSFGRFSSPPQTEWLPDGRRMVLLRDFEFVELDGTRWIAKAAHMPKQDGDLAIDGASIPPVFWSIIGGPYEGLYRNASIVHDAECTPPYKHRWQDVHRMLYRAARAGGTSELKAKLIFAAVWHFGPRWPFAEESDQGSRLDRIGDALRLVAYIVKHADISLPAIEALSSDSLATGMTDAEYEEFARELKVCNDPEGPFLGAHPDHFNQPYRSDVMSTPSEPCLGF